MKKPFLLIANWKMNLYVREAAALAAALKAAVVHIKNRPALALAPHFLAICEVQRALGAAENLEDQAVFKVMAQDIAAQDFGAYTGKVNVAMIKELGVSGALVGHSEQRTLFGETNESVQLKIKKLLSEGLSAVLCLGETEEERAAGQLKTVLKTQLEAALAGLSKQATKRLSLAYEPVWAIGSGKTPSSSTVAAVHSYLREQLRLKFDTATAEKIAILYGGSVNSKNVETLLRLENVDGALIGGASLKKEEFLRIISLASAL